MKQLKVAIIHNIIAPYRIPLFEELAAQPNVDLTVYFCADTHKIRKWDVIRDLNFKYEMLPGFFFQLKSITCHFNPIIVQKIKNEKFDVVIIGGCSDLTTQLAFITSKILHTPIILWSEGIESSRSTMGKIISPLTNYIIKHVDAVINPGLVSKEFSIKIGADPKRIFIAPNIIDNTLYFERSKRYREQKTILKDQMGLKQIVIIFVGRIVHQKGLIYLIYSFEQLLRERNDISLIIVGDGPKKEEIEQYCVEHNIKDVYFSGWVNDVEEKIKLYSLSEIFVLPTLNDLAPLVLNEAMACSLPVIVTSSAGNAFDFIVEGKNGFIIEQMNTEQLYKSIKRIISENSGNKMGLESKSIIQNNFTVEKTVQGFINAIKYSIK